MTTMELFAIPGMDGSRKLRQMRRESKQRMNDAARSQMIAAAMMSSRSTSSKRKQR